MCMGHSAHPLSLALLRDSSPAAVDIFIAAARRGT